MVSVNVDYIMVGMIHMHGKNLTRAVEPTRRGCAAHRHVRRWDPSMIDEYHRVELGEIMSRTMSLENLRVQILVFLCTANLTALGFAVSNKKAAVVMLAAITMAFLATSDEVIRRWLISLYCRGLQIERRYAPDPADALVATYISVSSSRRNLFEKLSKIADIEDPTERNAQLRKIHTSKLGLWAPVLVGFAELAFAIGALRFLQWDFIL